MRDDDNATLRRTIVGKTDPSDAIDADDDDETRFGEPDTDADTDDDDETRFGKPDTDDDGDDFSADTDADTDDDGDDFSADTDADTDDDGDDFSADTDADTDDDDTDSDRGGDTGTARPANTPPRRRTLLERFTDSSSTESSADTENAPLGLTDYKPVYNQLVDAVHNTPNDYETIARLFDDFTARLTGEYSEERVEDATRAIVELSSLVFGVVPYPYNSAILADLMELASYAGYVDAQQLFYVWATILDCARLVREYGYDEAIRRTYGVTRRVIQNFSEKQWQDCIRVFLKDTGENDGTETEPQQGISAGGSGKTNDADAVSIPDANNTGIEPDTEQPESGTGTPTETPASTPKLLTPQGYNATDDRAPRSVPNYTPLGKRYEEDTP
jgi:hypothetical protein